MISPSTDCRIAALLDDPLVQMIMRADGVDRRALAHELGGVARRLREGAHAQGALAGWLAACGAANLRLPSAGACCR
jgi:hypothetical protein